MAHFKKILALLLAVCFILTVGVVAVSAAEGDAEDEVAAGGITVHYYCEDGTPTIYYWNALPVNLETSYPGKTMTPEGDNYYKYTFSNSTKINMLFIVNGKQSAELTRNTGEWWYKGSKWYDKKPTPVPVLMLTEPISVRIRSTLSSPPASMTATRATTSTAGTTKKRTTPTPTPLGEATSRV